MKKSIVLSLVLVMIFFVVYTGCVPTPETNFITQKDETAMLDTAKSDQVDSLQTMELPIGKYTFDKEDENVGLSVTVDAVVSIPDCNFLKTVAIEEGTFSQEAITGMFNYLYPDEKPTYIDSSSQVLTKEYYSERLQYCSELLEDDDFASKSVFTSKEEIEEEIERLKEAYRNAPDIKPEQQEIVSDGTILLNRDGTYFYLNASINNSQFIHVEIPNHDENGRLLLPWQVPRFEYNRTFEDQYDHTSRVPVEQAASQPAISQSEALSICREFFSAGGYENINLFRTYVVPSTDGHQSAWYFTFGREIGECVSYAPPERGWCSIASKYRESWGYETILMIVDAQGIDRVLWECPFQIKDVLVEQTKIIPFIEAKDKFESWVFTIYRQELDPAQYADLSEREIMLSVCSVDLVLYRILQKDSNGNQGLLIPVWLFSGSKVYHDKYKDDYLGGEWFTSSADGYEKPAVDYPIFIVNAIDGSIIDPQKGY